MTNRDRTVSAADHCSIPSSIGPYRVETILGQGGMGVVYRGVDEAGTPVAIKVMTAACLSGSEARRRFEREAHIRIEHPNVIRVKDAGTYANGTPYIVFELLEGANLDEIVGRDDLTFAEVVRMGRQVAAGLGAAHAAGVVHRDLKPSNIFRCHDGQYKLLDFGIALLSSRETQLTIQGAMLGTPSYLSPEQARGQLDVDERSDTWSLGAVLYRALAGRPPYDAESALATIVAVVMQDVIPIRVLAPAVPEALAAVVDRALRKPKEERWSTVLEVDRAMAEIDLGEAASRPVRTARRGAVGARSSSMPVDRARSESVAAANAARSAEHRVMAVLLAAGVLDLARLSAEIEGAGGVVMPLAGDRALGLFGVRSWEGDEVVRAAAAALRARSAAERMSVASGRAILRDDGIAGSALLAAEAGCGAGLVGVAVDREVKNYLAKDFSIHERPNELFELIRERDPAWPSPPADGPDDATVGREPELAQLRFGISSALSERRPLAVLVTGPAGIGKTRIRREMDRMLSTAPEPFVTLTGRAEPLQRGAALSLFASAVLGRARLGAHLRGWPSLSNAASPEERCAAVRCLVAEAFPRGGQASDECAMFLGELLGVAMPKSAAIDAARQDPRLMADRLRLALLDYVDGLSAQSAVALLLEDLQWADAASLDMLGELLDRNTSRPLVVFTTARPELMDERANLFGGHSVVHLVLRGLVGSHVASFVNRIAGRALPGALLDAITSLTGGNPFFVEQIVDALSDVDFLDADTTRLPLPLTVEAAVQSRLDHLPFAEKELCKRVALFGRPFSGAEAACLGAEGVETVLVSLTRREILASRARERRGTGREYHFRSSLVGDVAYRMLGDEQRQDLHRRLAVSLSKEPGCDQEEIASHHDRGGERRAAAERYVEATLAASRRGDDHGVLRCSEAALRLEPKGDALFALRMARSETLGFLGRRREQETEIRSALESARSDAEHARARTEEVEWLTRVGRLAEAAVAGATAVSAARAAGDREILAFACASRGRALWFAGKLTELSQVMTEAANLAEGGSIRLSILAAESRAMLASARGDPGERLACFREAAALLREAGNVRRLAAIQSNLADTYNRLGAYEEARAALLEALDGCRRVGHRVMEGYALLNLGYSLNMLGRHGEAMAAFAEAGTISEAINEGRLGVFVRLYRARALLGRVPPSEVAEDAERTATAALDLDFSAVAALALSLEARARLAAGEDGRALATSNRAMEILFRLGSIEEDEAELYVTHAEILKVLGRSAEAEAVLARGREQVEKTASGIHDPELRRRFLKLVPAHRKLFTS